MLAHAPHPRAAVRVENLDAAVTSLAWLGRFCAQAGADIPAPQAVSPAQMPEPYRRLLAHAQDMTSTLEQHHGQRVGLRVLRRERRERYYSREVLLTTPDAPVEYGVIRIQLTAVPPEVRELILAEHLPLGRLLQDHAVPYLSRPQEFYRFIASPYLQRVLELPGPATLYGRRNLLLNREHRLLADVVEILPPAGKAEASLAATETALCATER